MQGPNRLVNALELLLLPSLGPPWTFCTSAETDLALRWTQLRPACSQRKAQRFRSGACVEAKEEAKWSEAKRQTEAAAYAVSPTDVARHGAKGGVREVLDSGHKTGADV